MAKEITLMIEDTPVKCQKQDLIDNSDYFKAMFEGNFSERDKSIVTLQDIRLTTMHKILDMLRDSSYPLTEEDILPVLQTACMLQFAQIRDACVGRLMEAVTSNNCLEIWFLAESLNIRYLYLKAKNVALTDFNEIKDLNVLMELSISQLWTYLGNVVLNCECEMDVFEVLMRWHGENCDGDIPKMKQLMHCIDFNSLSLRDIKMMTMHSTIANSIEMDDLFRAMLYFKAGRRAGKQTKEIESFDKSFLDLAEKLVNSRKRLRNRVDAVFFVRKGPPLGPTESIIDTDDCFRRKRRYVHVEGNTKNTSSLLILDMVKKSFIKCVDVPVDKVNGLEGFHILGYKEQIFLFGGENMLGSGQWNLNFWVYNIIRENWEMKTQMPAGRRHFMSCICGPYLFIIGGTGSFRIVQDNMYWYNYKSNIWSTLITLPCPARQLIHCNFDDKLFLLNPTGGFALIYDNTKNAFIKLKVIEENRPAPMFPDNFSLFSYRGKVYMKSRKLIELIVEKNCVRFSKIKYLQPIFDACKFDWVDSILCCDILLTMYKCTTTDTATFEEFNMETLELSILQMPTVPNECYTFNYFTKWFTLGHHHILENDTFVNDYEESKVTNKRYK